MPMIVRSFMVRAEFLEILRESLERKIPQEEIEDNLQYYREYFEQSGRSDEEVCEELGDPRMIAKSVTNAYLASKGSMAEEYTQQARSEFSQRYGSASREHTAQYGTDDSAGNILQKITWGIIILVIIIILAFLVRLALILLIPVLFVVILWKLIRGDW